MKLHVTFSSRGQGSEISSSICVLFEPHVAHLYHLRRHRWGLSDLSSNLGQFHQRYCQNLEPHLIPEIGCVYSILNSFLLTLEDFRYEKDHLNCVCTCSTTDEKEYDGEIVLVSFQRGWEMGSYYLVIKLGYMSGRVGSRLLLLGQILSDVTYKF